LAASSAETLRPGCAQLLNGLALLVEFLAHLLEQRCLRGKFLARVLQLLGNGGALVRRRGLCRERKRQTPCESENP
jgi:hypothetical protein